MGAKLLSKIVLISGVLCTTQLQAESVENCKVLVRKDVASAVESARITAVNYPAVACFCKWRESVNSLKTENDSKLQPNQEYRQKLSTLALRELAIYQGFDDILIDRINREGFYTFRGVDDLCHNLRD